MRSQTRPYVDDIMSEIERHRPSLLSRSRGLLGWIFGTALLVYLLLIAAAGFLAR
jgi:hypothetical protein